MKKIILSISLLLATALTFASSVGQSTISAEKNISASIRSQIQFPEFLKEAGGEHAAVVFFNVTRDGGIEIQKIECDDANLRNDLMDQSANIRIDPSGLDTKSTYKIVIRFEAL